MSLKDKNLTFEKFFATQYKSQYDWDQAQKVFGLCPRKHKRMTGHEIKKMQIRVERLQENTPQKIEAEVTARNAAKNNDDDEQKLTQGNSTKNSFKNELKLTKDEAYSNKC